MGKLEEVKGILTAIGMPSRQTNDRSAYTLLSLATLSEKDTWQDAKIIPMRIVNLMSFMEVKYNKKYMPNTRETIRKDTLHQFLDAAIVERSSSVATNSPNYCYQLTKEMLHLIQSYGTRQWQSELQSFIEQHGTLMEKYSQQRDLDRIPVVINGQPLTFSTGEHNLLQKAILVEFASRFAPGSEVLYVGDTENKTLVKNNELLQKLGIVLTDNDKLPDVILYQSCNGWLYFIEAVTSVGPMSVKRVEEIKAITADCPLGNVYVTAFLDISTYKKFIGDLAWDTEVWIAENPSHMIHLNGDRFMGPR